MAVCTYLPALALHTVTPLDLRWTIALTSIICTIYTSLVRTEPCIFIMHFVYLGFIFFPRAVWRRWSGLTWCKLVWWSRECLLLILLRFNRSADSMRSWNLPREEEGWQCSSTSLTCPTYRWNTVALLSFVIYSLANSNINATVECRPFQNNANTHSYKCERYRESPTGCSIIGSWSYFKIMCGNWSAFTILSSDYGVHNFASSLINVFRYTKQSREFLLSIAIPDSIRTLE